MHNYIFRLYIIYLSREQGLIGVKVVLINYIYIYNKVFNFPAATRTRNNGLLGLAAGTRLGDLRLDARYEWVFAGERTLRLRTDYIHCMLYYYTIYYIMYLRV